jgi:hypothetical protein
MFGSRRFHEPNVSFIFLDSLSVELVPFTAFEPFGLWPASRAAGRKNESSRFAFFPYRKGGKENPSGNEISQKPSADPKRKYL